MPSRESSECDLPRLAVALTLDSDDDHNNDNDEVVFVFVYTCHIWPLRSVRPVDPLRVAERIGPSIDEGTQDTYMYRIFLIEDVVIFFQRF